MLSDSLDSFIEGYLMSFILKALCGAYPIKSSIFAHFKKI